MESRRVRERAPRREERVTHTLGVGFLAFLGLVAVMFLGFRFGLGMSPFRLLAGPPRPEPPAIQMSVLPSATPVPPTAVGTPVPTVAPTPIGPRPQVGEAAQRWVQAWEAGRYGDMYRMLSAGARQRISETAFQERYRAIAEGATIVGLKLSLPPVREPPTNLDRADVRFDARLQTGRFGELSEQYMLPLVLEEREWRVAWTPDLIFRDLAPDRTVRVFEEDPVRGQIVDRNGAPLATMARIPTLGVVPGALKERDRTIAELAAYLQADPNEIRRKIDAAKPDWWVPLGQFPPDRREELGKRFGAVPGVLVEERDARFYPHGATAPHLIGYVSTVLDDDLKTLREKGYRLEDVVGRAGIESSHEAILAGQRGGRLMIVDPNGDTVRVVAERPATPGLNVQLTIDVEIQKRVEAALGDKTGSIVLLDPRDNSVIAMASSPRFDPNGFIYGFAPDEWQRLSSDPRRPFQHRAAMSSYATGSIYKVISMAAGIERAGYRPGSTFQCGGSWSLPNSRVVFGDWVKTGHGRLDLSQGLVESCNIVFYEIGKRSYEIDQDLLPSYTRQFGLGEPTGINGVAESAGIVPGPEWKQKTLDDGFYPGDNVNLSIGQGFFEATPLQMANAYSALANGGSLRTPLLVRRVQPTMGNQGGQEFQSKEKRRLPMRPDTLAAIRDAMVRVNTTPKGTGYYAFNGYRIPTAGKTGSAENQHKEAHAWFAGFAPADRPEVVVIAMVEGGEMGGVVAAPLGRRAVEAVLGN